LFFVVLMEILIMRSVMTHQFSQVPRAKIPRAQFDRSHGHKTTFDSGYLIPFYVDEALPGDTFKMKLRAFARLATPVVPIMDNLFMDFFFFAVPNRLLWSNWEKFCGAQDDPGDSIDYTIPAIASATTVDLTTAGSIYQLANYMGLPYKSSVDLSEISVLPFRAYNRVWKDWFRDENLQDSPVTETDDGPDNLSSYPLLRRGKRHDYFTSCLPYPQKDNTAVSLPLGTSAPVDYVAGGATAGLIRRSDTDAVDGGGNSLSEKSSTGELYSSASTHTYFYDPNGTLIADLSSATAALVNDLRESFQTQIFLERDARGGTRYVELIKSHFGVTSPDFRLQRPEYLGGGSVPVNITPIAQTGETGTNPTGYLAAMGTASVNGEIGFVKAFTEHMTLLGLVSVRADLTYQKGLERMWSRSTRYDFYWPEFAHLGEQAVYNREIYYQNTSADDDVFGYQECYAEYRYKPSRISGLFQSDNATSLDFWHLSIDDASLPTLGDTFIQENPPVSRVVFDSDDPEFIFDSFMELKCIRPMPVYSVPGHIDHF
jgi:hypothetical protein